MDRWAAPARTRPRTPGFDERASAARRLRLVGYREDEPGPRWQRLFEATWPAYRAWYCHEGLAARPTVREAVGALREHMPELVPTYERLVALTGDDPVAAAMLTMWRAPLFATGCSQVVVSGAEPVLARNYDYDPALFEGVVASTGYGGRRVLGTSDMLWGLLDGMNRREGGRGGLAVSLTYGGRRTPRDAAPGFAIPLVLRALLQTCDDVDSAVARLRRVPVAQAYNLALVDCRGGHASVFVAPGQTPIVSRLAVTTNHRLDVVEDHAGAERLDSLGRQRALQHCLASVGSADRPAAGAGDAGARLAEALTRPPLRRADYDAGFGTLYTAVYRPALGTLTYHWPDARWERGFEGGADEESEFETWVSQDRAIR